MFGRRTWDPAPEGKGFRCVSVPANVGRITPAGDPKRHLESQETRQSRSSHARVTLR